MSFTASLSEIFRKNENGLLGAHSTWSRVRLGDVVSILNGFPFPSSQFKKGAGTPLLRIRDVLRTETDTCYDGDYDPTYLVQPRELVVGMDGDFNSALWSGPVALLNQRVCKLTPDERFFDGRFLAYVLPGYLNAINAETSSITVKHLSSRTVENIPLPLPPLTEQRRIVEEVDSHLTRLRTAVAALRRIQANLKRYRASVLKAACEGRLVPTEAELARCEGRDYEPADRLLTRILKERRAKWEAEQLAKMQATSKPPKDDEWKAKYQEPSAPDASGIPELPDGWVWTTAEQLAERITKGSSPGWQGFDYQSDGVRFLRSQNVRWGKLDLSDLAFLPKEFNLTHRHSIVREGDVLLNLVGASVGRSAIATHEVDGANTNQAVGIIRPLQSGLINRLLMYILISPYGQAHITQIKADVARANFNLDDIRLMPVPLPPFTEQSRIVAEAERRLSLIDELESMVNSGLKRAERLRQAILKRAFEGKLVPQDPNDEPAIALLERIRAERTKSEQTRAPRGEQSRQATSRRQRTKAEL